MTRLFPVTLVVVLSLALFTCLGCEGPPEASADYEPTRAQMSERSDTQCASAAQGCQESCLYAKETAAPASHGGEGCPKPGCTCPHAGKEGCPKASPVAGGAAASHEGCAKSDNPCPHASREGCTKTCALANDEHVSAAHAGCPRAAASDTELDSEDR